MMQNTYQVKKIKRPIHWTVEVPGSKSITNRALLLAALTEGTVCLDGVLFSDDSRYFLRSLQSLGFRVDIREETCQVTVKGCGGRIPVSEGEIYVGSAGTAARFLTAMLGVSDGVWRIQASPQMQRRPMKPLFEALLSLGARIEWLGETWHLPVCITGAGQRRSADAGIEVRQTEVSLTGAGQRRNADAGIESGQTETSVTDEGVSRPYSSPAVLQMDISESTQFLSGFLLIAPMFPGGLRIRITSEKKDGSYIRITRRMMEEFGVSAEFRDDAYIVPAGSAYKRETYQIEPDVSAACYFYAAAAVAGGDALVRHVHRTGMQGDLKFLDVLEQMGCVVCDEPAGIRVTGPGGGVDGTAAAGPGQNEPDDVCDAESGGGKPAESGRDSPVGDQIHNGTKDGLPAILPGKLHGITVDMNDFSDQALTLAAIAPYADDPVRITNIAHIRRQESDRIHAIVSNLDRAGIACEEYPDGVKIFPGQPRACRIETFDDHRVAMAFAVMGLRADGIEIENPGCCRKTFEHYFEILDDFYK